MRDRSHDDAMAELFRHDPAFAANFLTAIMIDGDLDELAIFVRQLVSAMSLQPEIAHLDLD